MCTVGTEPTWQLRVAFWPENGKQSLKSRIKGDQSTKTIPPEFLPVSAHCHFKFNSLSLDFCNRFMRVLPWSAQSPFRSLRKEDSAFAMRKVPLSGLFFAKLNSCEKKIVYFASRPLLGLGRREVQRCLWPTHQVSKYL